MDTMYTFKLATKSAVSNKVNWLIWSTIPETFELVAPSVEAHRFTSNGFLLCAREAVAIRRGQDEGRERTQLRAAVWQANDMMVDWEVQMMVNF